MWVISHYARRAMAGSPPLEGPIELQLCMIYVRPNTWSKKKKAATFWKSSKPDSDNLAKIFKDAMNQIVWLDDAQVADLRVQKVYGDTAGTIIRIRQITQESMECRLI